MKKTITMIAVLLTGYTSFGQQMSATQKYFGGPQADRVRSITKISDSEFLLVGEMDREPNPGPSSIMAIKIDAQLNPPQTYRLYTESRDLGYVGFALSDGTLAIAGHTSQNGYNNYRDDGLFVRFNTEGNILTQKTWGDNTTSSNSDELELFGGTIDGDGNIVLVGVGYQDEPSANVPVIKKLTPNGFDIWSYRYPQAYSTRFQRVINSDNALYTVGYIKDMNDNYNNIVVKLDVDGNAIWSRIYDFTELSTTTTSANTIIKSIELTDDGNLLIGYSFFDDHHKMGLLKIDDSGSILWKRQVNFGTEHSNIYRLKPGHNDNEYVCVGNTYSLSQDNSDGLMFSFNDTPQGPEINWVSVFPGSGEDRFYDVESFVDGENKGYMVVGETNSFSNNEMDGWIVRTDQFGGSWDNDECWMTGLPISFSDIAMNATSHELQPTPWNPISEHTFTFDQPIIAPLHNDGLCQPLPLDNSTSINEVTKEEFGLNVYPNPSNGIIQIDTELERFNAELIDLSGRSITRQDFIHQRGTLNVSGICATGTYILRITSGDQWVHQLVQIR